MGTKNILIDENEITINSFKNRLKSLGFKKIIDGCDYTTYRYDELCEDTSKFQYVIISHIRILRYYCIIK